MCIRDRNKSNGNLIEIHKAVIKQAFKYNDTTHKFHPPEIWLMQLSRMFDLNIPLSADRMNYNFKSRPTNRQRQLSWILREIGNSPYRAKQPNGWSDIEPDWVSPELLLRRFWFASVELPMLVKSGNQSHNFIISCLKNNFDNYESMASLIHQFRFGTTEKDLGRKYGVICNLPGVLKV